MNIVKKTTARIHSLALDRLLVVSFLSNTFIIFIQQNPQNLIERGEKTKMMKKIDRKRIFAHPPKNKVN